jgi:hypothetical protein
VEVGNATEELPAVSRILAYALRPTTPLAARLAL